MNIVKHTYRLLAAAALAISMATVAAPEAAASVTTQPGVSAVQPVNGKDGTETHGKKKDGNETHGSAQTPDMKKDACETHD